MGNNLDKLTETSLRVKYLLSRHLEENYDNLDHFHQVLIPKRGSTYKPFLYTTELLCKEYGITVNEVKKLCRKPVTDRERALLEELYDLWYEGWFFTYEQNPDISDPIPAVLPKNLLPNFSKFLFFCSLVEPA